MGAVDAGQQIVVVSELGLRGLSQRLVRPARESGRHDMHRSFLADARRRPAARGPKIEVSARHWRKRCWPAL
jgi:hypothetical protein